MEGFIAGSIGGAAGIIVGHPLDTIKCRLQTQGSSGYIVRYNGPLHCTFDVIRTEGFRALYKGLSTPVITNAGLNAVLFGTYSKCVNYIQPYSTERRIKLSTCVTATLVAALIQSPLDCTTELLKVRLQVHDIGSYYYTRFSTKRNVVRGPVYMFFQILRTEGLSGLFKGLPTVMVRDVWGCMGYFIPYEFICQYMAGDNSLNVLQPYQLAVIGGIAGVITWAICYPLDVIKSRIQVDGINGPPQYRGMWDCIRKSYHSEGWRVFFKGYGTCLFRAFPVNATTFCVITALLRLMKGSQHNSVL